MTGIISTIINYLIFLISFNKLNFSLFVSLTLGYITGSFFSFHYGRTWIFGIKNKFKITQLIKFIICYGFGFFILRLISYKLNDIYLNASYKWLLMTIPIIVSNYCLLKFWVFKKK